ATALAHLRQPVPELPSTVPPALAAVIRRAMAKAPEDRYADGTAFAGAVREASASPLQDDPDATKVIAAVPAVGAGAASAAAAPSRSRRVPVPVGAAAGVLVLVVAAAALAALTAGGDSSPGTDTTPPPATPPSSTPSSPVTSPVTTPTASESSPDE